MIVSISGAIIALLVFNIVQLDYVKKLENELAKKESKILQDKIKIARLESEITSLCRRNRDENNKNL